MILPIKLKGNPQDGMFLFVHKVSYKYPEYTKF